MADGKDSNREELMTDLALASLLTAARLGRMEKRAARQERARPADGQRRTKPATDSAATKDLGDSFAGCLFLLSLPAAFYVVIRLFAAFMLFCYPP